MFLGLERIISDNHFNCKSRAQALSHLNSIKNSSFLISLACVGKVMSITIILFKMLQTVNLNYVECMQLIESTIETLALFREDSQQWNGNKLSVFSTAESYSLILGITLSQPRNSSKGIYSISYDESCVTISTSSNLISESTCDYYSQKIWIPY